MISVACENIKMQRVARALAARPHKLFGVHTSEKFFCLVFVGIPVTANVCLEHTQKTKVEASIGVRRLSFSEEVTGSSTISKREVSSAYKRQSDLRFSVTSLI